MTMPFRSPSQRRPTTADDPVASCGRRSLLALLGLCCAVVFASAAAGADPAWQLRQWMNLERGGHCAVLLKSGKVLVVGGYASSELVSDMELYDPETDSWEMLPDFWQGNSGHTATLLSSGRVLLVGGNSYSYINPGLLTTCYIYPWELSGTTQPPPIKHARRSHTATLLPNGQVMVAGGDGLDHVSKTSVEIYDPVLNQWTDGPPLLVARAGHTATLLPSGDVLIVGGDANGVIVKSSAELYNPVTGIRRLVGTTAETISGHTATLKPNGTVVVVYRAKAQAFTIASETWSAATALLQTHTGHSATLLPSGDILIVGGNGTACEVLEGDTNQARSFTPLLTPRSAHSATVLPSGQLLVAGGIMTAGTTYATSQCELVELHAPRWSSVPFNQQDAMLGSIVTLPSGNLFCMSPSFAGPSKAGILDTTTNTWQVITPPAASPSSEFSLSLLASGEVLVSGGHTNGYTSGICHIFTPGTLQWRAVGSLHTPRTSHRSQLLPNGKVLVAGGYSSFVTDHPELFDPVTETWSGAGYINIAHLNDHRLTPLYSGKILVTGSGGGSTPDCAIYDPYTNSFSETKSPGDGLSGHTANLLPDGRVLVAFHTSSTSGGVTTHLNRWQIFDPVTERWSAPASLPINERAAGAFVDGRGDIITLLVNGPHCITFTSATDSWTTGPSLQNQPVSFALSRLAGDGALVHGYGNAADRFVPQAYHTSLQAPP
jgi:hypothetical protein